MKQLVKQEPHGGNRMAPKTNSLFPHVTTDSILIKEVETEKVITRERTYITVRPVCPHCGGAKERVMLTTPSGNMGIFWACGNAECPSNDPEGGASAIPLREEGKKLIDVKPIKEAA